MKARYSVLLALLALLVAPFILSSCSDDDDDTVTVNAAGSMEMLIAGQTLKVDDQEASLVIDGNTGVLTLKPFELNQTVVQGTMSRTINVALNEPLKIDVVISGDKSFTGEFLREGVSTSYGGTTSNRTLKGTVNGQYSDGGMTFNIVFPPMGWEGMPMQMVFSFNGEK